MGVVDWRALFNFSGGAHDLARNVGAMDTPPSAGLVAGRAGRALKFATTDVSTTTGRIVPGISAGVTAVMVAEPLATTTANNFLFAEARVGGPEYNWGFYESSSGILRAYVHNGSAGVSHNTGYSWSSTRNIDVLVMTYGDGDNFVRVYRNGAELLSGTAQTGNIQRHTSAGLGMQCWNTSGCSMLLYAAAVLARRMSAAEVAARFGSLSSAWSALFGRRRAWVLSSVPAASAGMDAAFNSVASMPGAALTTEVRMGASVAAVAAITAGLTTGISVASSQSAASSLTAALSTSITPASSLAGQATITADLTTGVAVWASSQTAMTTIAAALSTGIQASASLAAHASLSGTLGNEALFESASGFKVSKLPYDPRLPIGTDPRALQARLYEVLRQFATVANAHDDGYVAAVANVSENYVVQRGDSVILVDASAGAVTISLQAPAEAMHKTISVRKIDASANIVAVVPPSGKVDGSSTLVLTAASPKVTLASSGGSYYSV